VDSHKTGFRVSRSLEIAPELELEKYALDPGYVRRPSHRQSFQTLDSCSVNPPE